MEERCVGVVSGWSSPTGRSGVGTAAPLRRGAGALGMTIAGGVPLLGAESPSCLFSPPSESALASQLALSASCDQRAPCSLAGVVSHDPGMASRQVAPPFGSRACCFLSAFSPTLTKSAAATSTAHTFPANQLSCLFTKCLHNNYSSSLRLTKKQEKSTTPPSPTN